MSDEKLKERMAAVEKQCAEASRRVLAECEPVTNGGTVCGEGEVSDVVKGAIPVREVDAVLRDFWRKGEIKPLDHWRRLDEVGRNMLEKKARARGWLLPSDVEAGVVIPGYEVEFVAGPSEIAVPEAGVEFNYDVFVDAMMAAYRRWLTEKARVSFPARALRDRPWDISALVEE